MWGPGFLQESRLRLEAPAKKEEPMPKPNGQSLPVRKSRTDKKQATHEEIQLRAYEIYLERGSRPGNPLDDWVRAERELLHTNGTVKRASKTTAA